MACGIYRGVGPDTLKEWQNALGTTEKDSTRPERIAEYFQELGCPATLKCDMTLDDLKRLTAAGWPVIVFVQEYMHDKGIKARGDEYGHILSVIDVTDQFVVVNDSSEDNVVTPDVGSLNSKGKAIIDKDVFLKNWHDRDYHRCGIAIGPKQGSEVNQKKPLVGRLEKLSSRLWRLGRPTLMRMAERFVIRFDKTRKKIAALPHEHELVSTRAPSGAKAVEDPLAFLQGGTRLLSDYPSMQRHVALHKINPIKRSVDLMVRYPGMSHLAGAKGSPTDKANALIEHLKKNILMIHDLVPKSFRDRSKNWYDGGHAIVQEIAKAHGVLPRQAAAVIAALSPRADWFRNVDTARRLVKLYTSHRGTIFDKNNPAMVKAAEKIIANVTDYALQRHAAAIVQRGLASRPKEAREMIAKGEDPLIGLTSQQKEKFDRLVQAGKIDSFDHKKNYGQLERTKRILKSLVGHSFDSIKNGVKKAWMIRLLDDAYNEPGYNIITPEGNNYERAKTKSGKEGNTAWNSAGAIKKAISVLQDGSLENISEQLGDAHKIRNFYNNLMSPNSPENHTTIDTHAVAAALLLPLSGTDTPVLHNFGSGGAPSSSRDGSSGTYPLYHEAYLRAANERGILPREMQSIVWEAIRGLFDPSSKKQKGEQNLREISQIWKDYDNARKADTTPQDTPEGQSQREANDHADREHALKRILEYTHGIGYPFWARRRRDRTDEGTGDAGNPGELLGTDVPGRPSIGRERPKRKRGTPAGGTGTAASGAVPEANLADRLNVVNLPEKEKYAVPKELAVGPSPMRRMGSDLIRMMREAVSSGVRS